MNPRSMSGGRNFAIIKFDKWGKMTDKYFKSKIIESKLDLSNKYSIYDWFEDLKSMQWSRKSINKSELKKWTDHFIGGGWYYKISNLVDNIFDSIRKTDIEYVEGRMLEVWDELPSEKEKYVMFAVAYGDYENFDKEIDYRYSGLISVMSPQDDDRKLDVIIHIIKDIIYPTTHIGSPSIWLRRSREQEYVTDKKWNCENFNIDNYGFKEDQEFDNGTGGRRSTTTIFKHELEAKRDYSPDKVIQMYKPCVVIEVGGYHDSHMTGRVKLSHLEPLLDDALETILPELDYEAIIWDKARGKRKFTDDEFSDYTLKIILK
jgi:hypothetical protein